MNVLEVNVLEVCWNDCVGKECVEMSVLEKNDIAWIDDDYIGSRENSTYLAILNENIENIR